AGARPPRAGAEDHAAGAGAVHRPQGEAPEILVRPLYDRGCASLRRRPHRPRRHGNGRLSRAPLGRPRLAPYRGHMSSLKDTIVAYVEEQIKAILAAPRMWGSNE